MYQSPVRWRCWTAWRLLPHLVLADRVEQMNTVASERLSQFTVVGRFTCHPGIPVSWRKVQISGGNSQRSKADLAWKIPWTEEPPWQATVQGVVKSQARLSTCTHAHACTHTQDGWHSIKSKSIKVKVKSKSIKAFGWEPPLSHFIFKENLTGSCGPDSGLRIQ